jgi:hypothetical protein
MVQVGQTYTLHKCKHSWNNGVVVTIKKVEGDDEYLAESEDGRKFIVGIKNLKA